MRLSKLEVANHLGISPTTVNRRIKSGVLKVEKESHGSSYKIWVILDDEPAGNPGGVPLGIPSGTPGEYAVGIPVVSHEQPGESPGGIPPAPEIVAPALQMAILQERNRNLEELAQYHKGRLNDAEWRYQELLQELRQSQQNVAALTRALPAPALEPTDPEQTTVIVTADEQAPRRRRWWPFGRG